MERNYFVPETVVSTDPEIEKLRKLLTSDDDNIVVNKNGDLMSEKEAAKLKPEERKKYKQVPDTIVSAGQWYVERPDLMSMEIKAMRDFQGENAKLGYFNDGRAYWLVECQPSIAGKRRAMCRKYTILMVYDKNHPHSAHGSSVKAYFLKPTIEDLQEIVNRTPGVSPKNIPHLIRDGNSELYMCSIDQNDTSGDKNSRIGITSAATSLRAAFKWINVFELGLIDPDTWSLFQQHGKI